MQTMMVKSGGKYREATPAEIFEAAGHYALEAFNKDRPVLVMPSDAVEYLRRIYIGRDYETFSLLTLDASHRLISCRELFRGTVDKSSVHPREVVKECLWQGAVAAIFAHNHPSGVAEPSGADEGITRRLQQGLALIDVRVLDHLIIGGTGKWQSMRAAGRM